MTGDGSTYLSGKRMGFAVVLLAFSNLMVVLDLTVANVAVPHISGNLGISPDQGTWVITSYAVAEAISVPLTGWLAQRFGTVRCFSLAMAGFGVFSFLCGFAPTLGLLVASRIGQGLCGGLLIPLSQTLLMRLVPPEKRSAAMAIWAMTSLVGPIAGPLTGGWISDNWSWHWVFFINIPAAALCVLGSIALLTSTETRTAQVPIDIVGLSLLIFWIGCMQIVLDIGRDHDWFGDPHIIMLSLSALIGLVAFVIWELTVEHPIVDLRIFRHTRFTFGVLSLGLCFGSYFAGMVVTPQWLQTSMGYDAATSGLSTALGGVAALMTAPLAGKLTPKVDARYLIAGGVGWIGIFSAIRAMQWSSSSDFFTLAWPQFVQGFGLPFFFIPLTTMTLSSVPPAETASAAGLQNFLRTMAIAISTSLVLTIWGDGQRVSRNEIVGKLQADQVTGSLSGAGFSQEQISLLINQLVEKEAIALAITHVFAVSAVLLFATAAFILLAPQAKRGTRLDMSAAH